jgi:hypothetical protein
LIVSGCVTSPCELSRIDSGEAKADGDFGEVSVDLFIFSERHILYG